MSNEMEIIKSKVYSVILSELMSEYCKIGTILNNKRLSNSFRADIERKMQWNKAKGMYDLLYNEIQELINKVDSTLDNSIELTQNINSLIRIKSNILVKLRNLDTILEPFKKYSHFK